MIPWGGGGGTWGATAWIFWMKGRENRGWALIYWSWWDGGGQTRENFGLSRIPSKMDGDKEEREKNRGSDSYEATPGYFFQIYFWNSFLLAPFYWEKWQLGHSGPFIQGNRRWGGDTHTSYVLTKPPLLIFGSFPGNSNECVCPFFHWFTLTFTSHTHIFYLPSLLFLNASESRVAPTCGNSWPFFLPSLSGTE